ncbi:MAG: metalloregulator ArsR/SmtB family transcription factor [Pseudomonadota bacterium]|nr:MAG: transcriptional regulator [Pseudomonadota bacterium]
MVEHHSASLDAVFHALSDPTRRAMIQRLGQRERTVSELCEPFSMSLAGASKHLKVLEEAGLVRRRIVGRTHYCSLRATRLAEAHRWLARYERYWNERLDALEALLEAEEEHAATRGSRKSQPRRAQR